MDAMSPYHAKTAIEARLASAQEQRAGRQIQAERRHERRRRRRLWLARRWRAWLANGPEIGSWSLLSAPDIPPTVELDRLLNDAAHRITEHGTGSEWRLLDAMAAVVVQSAPGAADALTDRSGSEVSRLRAFGVVHAHLMQELGPREHVRLLDVVQGRRALENPGRVA